MVRAESYCQNGLSAKIRKRWCSFLVRMQLENWMVSDSNAIFKHSWLYFVLVKSKSLRTGKNAVFYSGKCCALYCCRIYAHSHWKLKVQMLFVSRFFFFKCYFWFKTILIFISEFWNINMYYNVSLLSQPDLKYNSFYQKYLFRVASAFVYLKYVLLNFWKFFLEKYAFLMQ